MGRCACERRSDAQSEHSGTPSDTFPLTGPDMIHLMELPNPDPSALEARPAHGGRDRHSCFGVRSCDKLAAALSAHGVVFTRSNSGRAALFFRDPDGNTLECAETEPWRGDVR